MCHSLQWDQRLLNHSVMLDSLWPPGSSVHGIFQPRILEWVIISSSRGSFWPRDRTLVSRMVGEFFTTNTTCFLHLKENKSIFIIQDLFRMYHSFKWDQREFSKSVLSLQTHTQKETPETLLNLLYIVSKAKPNTGKSWYEKNTNFLTV